jgi:hypothetical protein
LKRKRWASARGRGRCGGIPRGRRPLAHRERRPLLRFAADASRIRDNPEIVARMRSFAEDLRRASGWRQHQSARWRAAIDIDTLLKHPD